MNIIDLNATSSGYTVKPNRSILFYSSLATCAGLLLIGVTLWLVMNRGTVKSEKVAPEGRFKQEDIQKELQTPVPPPEPPTVIIKKPQQPITVEEGSEAWFCLKNNGGSSCISRDRFVPNHKIVAPPKQAKTYEDYLVQYGIRNEGNCGRWLNGKPHCTGF